MKKYLIALSIILATTAHAQAPVQQKKLKIELTVQEVEVVLQSLQKLPYEQSAAIIQSIYGQAQKQISVVDTTKKK
jgi:hypothetical protein